MLYMDRLRTLEKPQDEKWNENGEEMCVSVAHILDFCDEGAHQNPRIGETT